MSDYCDTNEDDDISSEITDDLDIIDFDDFDDMDAVDDTASEVNDFDAELLAFDEFEEAASEGEDIIEFDGTEDKPDDEGLLAAPSFSSALENSDLFDKFEAGEYQYEEMDGKKAFGSLKLTDNPQRNAYAQRTIGGADRQECDDGGHLIGARFGGASGYENLDAQSRDLNRGGYKAMENEWAESLDNGDRVFVDVETYKSGSDRPDAWMGFDIIEHPDGTRDWDAFSFQNTSVTEQREWEDIILEFDDEDEDY